jgi:galactokinase
MGEHTDYNGGFVLPFALAQGVTATAAARDDGLLVLHSSQVPGEGLTVPLDSLAPGSVRGWAAYPAGVAWALRTAGYPVRGASVDIDSDLPAGAGLSSSAALECATALALIALAAAEPGLAEPALTGSEIERPALAAIAQRAENDFVGAPTGIIDQSAALLGQEGHALLLDCGTMEVAQVPFRPAVDGVRALIIDTRVTHALVSGEYAARRAECEEAARQLGVPALGAVTDPRAADKLDDPVLRRRARHVITARARAREIADALTWAAAVARTEPGQPAGAGHDGPSRGGAAETYRFTGQLLLDGHASLRDDFQVSWPQADECVESAVAAGAYGAKMIGGGFGGSVLALVPTARLSALRGAVAQTFAARDWTAPEFLDAVPSPAARQLA